jgi:hypothetical protein
MAAQAKLSSAWLIRMGLITVLFLVFGVWGTYDALVAYPAHNAAIDQYQQILDNQGEDAALAFAEEQGWEAGQPPERYSSTDIGTQYIFMVGGFVVGLAALVWLLMNLPRKVASDEQGLHCPGGPTIPYDAIQRIDKDQWDRKAIAIVHYEHNGKAGTCKLDDWKFRGAAQVLAEVEQKRGSGDQAVAEEPD